MLHVAEAISVLGITVINVGLVLSVSGLIVRQI